MKCYILNVTKQRCMRLKGNLVHKQETRNARNIAAKTQGLLGRKILKYIGHALF